MTKYESEEHRQIKAYLSFKAILPGDIREITCTESDQGWCRFRLKSGSVLACEQPANEKIKEGETISLVCSRVEIGRNGYGLFVDYVFMASRLNHTVRINGPDAQALKEGERK
ncbi:MAG: hypothetical protein Q4B26_00955 [Eubacteriales bacterium]|nr:hypothetical protein [Eubacteriales bacterium]